MGEEETSMYDYRKMTPEQRRAVLEERRKRGFPLHAPPHFKGVSGWYLITATCYEHRPIFEQVEDLSLLTNETLSALHKAGFEWGAWVFLPNHYHLLLKVSDMKVISEFLRRHHSLIATRINIRHNQKGRKVWYRFSDRFIRSERHYWATVNYIHYNPVKHGYVDDPVDWCWSSIHVYLATFNSKWLKQLLNEYPIRDYGKGWDW